MAAATGLVQPTLFSSGLAPLSSNVRQRKHPGPVQSAHPEGEAKFWLTPSVHLAKNVGLSGVQLRQAQAVVEAHIQEIQDAWNSHFGG